MIIIVDDRNVVAGAMQSLLGKEGIAATGFSTRDFAEWVSSVDDNDVVSVDAFLLGESDELRELAAMIRRRSTAALIALKDCRNLLGTLESFASGVDDVITKPCHAKEILARIEAISRRTRELRRAEATPEIVVFRDGREPLVHGAPLRLPRRELRILEYFVSNAGRRVSRSQIFGAVYGLFDHQIEETVVESHISKLRRRLRQRLGYDPIESRRHLGYCFTSANRAGADAVDKPGASGVLNADCI